MSLRYIRTVPSLPMFVCMYVCMYVCMPVRFTPCSLSKFAPLFYFPALLTYPHNWPV